MFEFVECSLNKAQLSHDCLAEAAPTSYNKMLLSRRLDRCDRMIQNESRDAKAFVYSGDMNANYVPYAHMPACPLCSIRLESIASLSIAMAFSR